MNSPLTRYYFIESVTVLVLVLAATKDGGFGNCTGDRMFMLRWWCWGVYEWASTT